MRNLVYKSRAQFAKDHQQYKKVVIASHCLNLVRACLDKSLARSIVQDMKSIAASLECSFFLCISFFFLRRWCQLGNELQYHKRMSSQADKKLSSTHISPKC